MKLTLKSLKQVPYEIEVESEDSLIAEVKKSAEELHGFDKSCLKLLFNGSILEDSKTLSNYNIKDGNVLVMMNAKAKPINVNVKKEVETKPIENTTTNITSNINTNTLNNNSSNVAKKEEEKDYTSEINQLVDMGFIKSESEAAIKLAKGNMTIAIEFLYNGIPDNLPLDEGNVENESSGGQVNEVLNQIASFVKVMCQNSGDPNQLQTILLSLQRSRPELLELIKDRQNIF